MSTEEKRIWLCLLIIVIGITIKDIGMREQFYGSQDMDRAVYSDDDFASELDEGYERGKIGGFIYAFGMGLFCGGIVGLAFILNNRNKKIKKIES